MSKTPRVPKTISDDVSKGVLVDGMGVTASRDSVIVDGIIGPPRYSSQVTVVRIIFPTRMLPDFIKILTSLQEKRNELKPQLESKEASQ
ncbi:hypothetical protein MUP00_11005 [Candidatus Bathyarchaeota archaeon]|nr:hypothetical protein [Candidatus Bathyarchaeota archaeon]